MKGMTLIEVMISLLILSFIAIFTGQSIRNALNSKTRIQKNIDVQGSLRDALSVMERDINLAFQFRDPNISLYNAAIQQREKNLQEQQKGGAKPPPAQAQNGMGGGFNNPFSDTPPAEKLAPRPVRVLTQFVGEKDKLSFSSLSNVRLRADDPSSSIAEIGYSLKNCRRRTSQEKSSSCLWRRVSPMLGTDITKGGSETVLLENVEDFQLRYLGPGKPDEWVDFWASNERGDDTTRFKFPYAVEITLEVSDPTQTNGTKKRTYRMTKVAEIRNPNNLKNDASANGQGPSNDGNSVPPINDDGGGEGGGALR
jgi:prepilin-type N-terminal cleavage/methylation domain-containing protein